MKKKGIAIAIWMVLSILYCLNIADIGRSMGANANSAIENYTEYYTKEYYGVEGLAEAATNAWSYSEFDNLEKEYKGDFAVIGVTTVIYAGTTVLCYHFGIKKEKRRKSA